MAETRQTADDRVPPSDTAAEQATLGCILLETEAAERALGVVTPADFYREAHQLVATAAAACRERGEPVDLVTVSTELKRAGNLERVGGAEYLTALINKVPTAAHVMRYATIVAEKSLSRAIIARAAAVQAAAYADPEDPAGLAARTATEFQELYRQRVRVTSQTAAEHATAAWADFEQLFLGNQTPELIRTGVSDFDRRTGGMEAQRLVVIMGDTKHGKSTLARQAAIETCRKLRRVGSPKRVLAVILEEDEKLYRAKTLSYLGQLNNEALTIPGRWLQMYGADETASDRYTRANEELEALPLDLLFGVDDYDKLVGEIRQWAESCEPAMVLVDYFQLITEERQYKTEEQGFKRRARGLRQLADELEIPIITPSQVTYNKDLRAYQTMGARAIEHEASLVMELSRQRDKGTNELTNRGTLSCKEVRIGHSFGAVDIRTYLEVGRILSVDDATLYETERARRREARDHDN